ncbi:hypothetical protein ABW21_db0201222 [Orbilia brochopaga]|nr:hypothetical protein ABW21_db0201222 [Drechslerella brochopaga]
MAVRKSTKRKAAASNSLASTRLRKIRRAPAKKTQEQPRRRAPARQNRDSSDEEEQEEEEEDDDEEYNDDHDDDDTHKDIYKRALGDFKTFCTILQEEVTKVDWTVPILPLEKHNLFRIFRDVRFSNSKVPFKEYFSVAFSRTGKQGLYAKYYLSVQAGDQSFIGGGLWHPEATHVSLMRRDIDKNPRRLKDILVAKDFYANFLDSGSASGGRKPATGKKVEELALKSFVGRNSEDALKTAPKGYDKGHPDIDLLRLKSYTVGKRITDAEMLLPNAMDQLVELIRILEPLASEATVERHFRNGLRFLGYPQSRREGERQRGKRRGDLQSMAVHGQFEEGVLGR